MGYLNNLIKFKCRLKSKFPQLNDDNTLSPFKLLLLKYSLILYTCLNLCLYISTDMYDYIK